MFPPFRQSLRDNSTLEQEFSISSSIFCNRLETRDSINPFKVSDGCQTTRARQMIIFSQPPRPIGEDFQWTRE